jgi:putative peptidoglycan lipid II flippase
MLALRQRLGIWALALGTVAGTAVQAIFLARSLRRFDYSIAPRWYGANDDTREIWRQFWPVLFSSVVASGGLLIDQAMAAMLPPGSVSSLAFGGRYVGVMNTLLVGAISSVLAPHFSVLAAHRDWTACRAALRHWSLRIGAVSSAVAVALIAASPWLVRTTLQHGAFAAQDTHAVAPVLAMYAVQIPFYAVSRVYYRFLVGMRRTDLVLYCGSINLVLDVILNLVLMRRMGVAGIALATSLWNICTCGFLWIWSRRVLHAASGTNR